MHWEHFPHGRWWVDFHSLGCLIPDSSGEVWVEGTVISLGKQIGQNAASLIILEYLSLDVWPRSHQSDVPVWILNNEQRDSLNGLMTEPSGRGCGASALGGLSLQRADRAFCSWVICIYLSISSHFPTLVLQIPVNSEGPFCLW